MWSVWVAQIAIPAAVISTIVRAGNGADGIRSVLRLRTLMDFFWTLLIIIPFAYLVGVIFWRLKLTGDEVE